jgi:hypothetical protein
MHKQKGKYFSAGGMGQGKFTSAGGMGQQKFFFFATTHGSRNLESGYILRSGHPMLT